MCGEARLKAFELIPVLSYLFIKGKCLTCKKKLPIRYLLVELLFLLTGLLCLYKYGTTLSFIFMYTAFCLLIIIGVVDYYRFIIPNILVIILLFVLISKIIFEQESIIPFVLTSLGTGAVFIFINYISGKIKGQDAIGLGDIKLIMVLMLMLEIPLSMIAIWTSALIAIPGFLLMKTFLKRFSGEIRIPFGMFISMGFILISFFSDKVYLLYFSLLGI